MNKATHKEDREHWRKYFIAILNKEKTRIQLELIEDKAKLSGLDRAIEILSEEQ